MKVSRLSLGTAELGLGYGIGKPGSSGGPDAATAIHLLHKAADSGINLFDTAPRYGSSEEILGKALSKRDNCIVATKVNIPPEDIDAKKFVMSSLGQSCKRLRRECLDIVQVHNATVDTFLNNDILTILAREKEKGNLRFIGASVYDPENALAGIDFGMIDVLQVAYNILDQRMRYKVFDEAASKGIGVLGRSVYLKGALTQRVEGLPEHLAPLKRAIENLKSKMNLNSWNELSSVALRFALSNLKVSSALVGVSSEGELDFALDAAKRGGLNNSELCLAYECAMNDKFWLNPSNWIL